MTGNSSPRPLLPPYDPDVEPVGSITGGLLDRMRRHNGTATVSEPVGSGTDAPTFVSTIERAASGLASRGVCPGDVVAVLAPVSPARLTAVYTVMAVGGVVLPLERNATVDTETQIDALTKTDTRLLLVTSPLATVALQLAERSRVRQVIAFGQAPETTPFEELLASGAERAPHRSHQGSFDNGVLGYQTAGDGAGVVTTLHSHTDLLHRFRRFDAELDLGPGDVVAVDPGMSEPARAALAALALWRDVSVVTIAPETEPEIRRLLEASGATVRGSPSPARVVTRE
ncbi:AMP-binding protein [Halostreptopolyspora alba]|uniref:AMP-dependent synthetase/ligase domain-containing protein n=1 Tax=Halostreptopolyspora alba TaxID=2487137 RepID=A0A3N0DYK0_9ACTN|nr:hypothetical protein EFW17_22710 [Nocardiopsaceae bacterium YIM 96095]